VHSRKINFSNKLIPGFALRICITSLPTDLSLLHRIFSQLYYPASVGRCLHNLVLPSPLGSWRSWAFCLNPQWSEGEVFPPRMDSVGRLVSSLRPDSFRPQYPQTAACRFWICHRPTPAWSIGGPLLMGLEEKELSRSGCHALTNGMPSTQKIGMPKPRSGSGQRLRIKDVVQIPCCFITHRLCK